MDDKITQQKSNTKYSLDEEFDPLADFDPDGDDDFSEYQSPSASSDEIPENKESIDDRPAAERIAELISRMQSQRSVLLGIIAFCENPKLVSETNDYIDELRANNLSVFNSAIICDLLEKAGAIEQVNSEGILVKNAKAAPKVIVENGVEYLVPADSADVYWKSTQAGLEELAANKPFERLVALFEDKSEYKPIYQRILTLCADEDGASTSSLGDAVDKDPLLQNPRFYASRFVDQLEKCEAVVWKKPWRITEVGKKGLELLVGDSEESSTATESEA
jgi:hypothetical protein